MKDQPRGGALLGEFKLEGCLDAAVGPVDSAVGEAFLGRLVGDRHHHAAIADQVHHEYACCQFDLQAKVYPLAKLRTSVSIRRSSAMALLSSRPFATHIHPRRDETQEGKGAWLGYRDMLDLKVIDLGISGIESHVP